MELKLVFGTLIICLGLLVFTFAFRYIPLWLFGFSFGGYYFVIGYWELIKPYIKKYKEG